LWPLEVVHHQAADEFFAQGARSGNPASMTGVAVAEFAILFDAFLPAQA